MQENGHVRPLLTGSGLSGTMRADVATVLAYMNGVPNTPVRTPDQPPIDAVVI
jgi:hypothetical protein